MNVGLNLYSAGGGLRLNRLVVMAVCTCKPVVAIIYLLHRAASHVVRARSAAVALAVVAAVYLVSCVLISGVGVIRSRVVAEATREVAYASSPAGSSGAVAVGDVYRAGI